MDSDELTDVHGHHTTTPEYNYIDGNSDIAAPTLLGPEDISGTVVATGMDYNQPIQFVSRGNLDLLFCLESSFSHYWTTQTSAEGTLTPSSLFENIAVWQMMKHWGYKGGHGLSRHHQGDVNCIGG
jgi:hypothetical protein